MVSPKQSHKQAKIINSLDSESMRKFYEFVFTEGGTVEQFIKAMEKGTIKVRRNANLQGTVTPKFSIEEIEE